MKPSIVCIYADDLGHGMLSCYGQQHFQTPNIDRLASEGVRFTRAYGTSMCALARACLLTGMHDAHAGRWTFNRYGIYSELNSGAMTLEQVWEVINNTGIRPQDGDSFLAKTLKEVGYVTGQIGKLEWGFASSDLELRQHGWDCRYGHYDHGLLHGYYPTCLFENGQRIDIPGSTRDDFGAGQYHIPGGVVEHDPDGRSVYSQDLFDEKIVEFLERHAEEPFLLYHPSQIPHGPVYDHEVPAFRSDDPDLTPVEREYAAMVLRLDRTVGLVLDTLDRLGLAEQTMVIFASDNGHFPWYQQPGRCLPVQALDGKGYDNITHKFYSRTDGDVFDGNGGPAGLKATNWEGGGRVPFIVRWAGHTPAGVTSDHLLANYDTLATLAEAADAPVPETDGVSYLAAALGDETGPEHEYIVYASEFGPPLVTRDGWKLRTYLHKDRIVDSNQFGASLEEVREAMVCQLYDLSADPAEERGLASEQPERLQELMGKLLRECDGNLFHGTPMAHFAFYNWGAISGFEYKGTILPGGGDDSDHAERSGQAGRVAP